MATPGEDDRELDLVLLGATGFVGRLVAAHLARSAPAGARVALAGRSLERLRTVRHGLGDAAASWELCETDVTSRAALDELARRTRVLTSTVGPYARHGLPVVEACALRGTHYADLTGETLFVRDSVATAHDLAVSSGARVVHSCGFDSVPSDLGVRLLADRAEADHEGTLTATTLHVRDMRGGVSGGTVDSLRQQAIAVQHRPDLRRVVGDPEALTGRPPSGRGRGGHPTLTRADDGGAWSAPFVMGSYNRQVVLRTDALLGGAYGPGFDYREVVDTARGPVGAGAAAVLAAVQATLLGSMANPLTRAVADRVLPAPGEGPSEGTRRRGRFAVEVETATTTGARYAAQVAAPYDPGYEGTAVLLGESTLALAFDDDLPDAAGVLTPMTGIGPGLARRLRAHGFEVDVRRLGANAS
jgi:short subunit dehydrogenase-like uncharacterized protein